MSRLTNFYPTAIRSWLSIGATRNHTGLFIIFALSAAVCGARPHAGWRAQFVLATLQQEGTNRKALAPHQPIEREIAAGQTDSYQIELSANRFVQVIVDQHGIKIEITLFDDGGKQLAKVGSPTEMQGPERLFWVAETGGSYRLDVRSMEPQRAGRYKVLVEGLRVATAQDRSRVAAQQAFILGKQLGAQQTAVSRRKAVEKYQESLTFWRAAGDHLGEALTLFNVGDTYNAMGEYQKALDVLTQALPLARAAADRSTEASTLNGIGVAYDYLGEKQRALDFYHQALSLRRALGDRDGEAVMLNNIGFVYGALGERQQALDAYNQVLSIMRALGDRQGEAITLNNIGSSYQDLGEYQKALDFYNQALPLLRAVGDRRVEGFALNNIGSIYQTLGEYQKALDFVNQSLSIMRVLGDRYSEVNCLNNIGFLYQTLGDYQKALDFYNQALPLTRAVGNRSGEGFVLNNIGTVYQKLGEYQKALDVLTQALSLRRALGERRGEAVTLSNVALAYRSTGERRQALDLLNQALQLHRAVKDPAGEANALYRIAQVERDQGALDEALTHIEAAINIVEALRTRVASQQLRTSYFASAQDNYEFYIGLLMRLHQQRPREGFDLRALQASERKRARGLLELLAEARADIRQGVDPVLLERERSLGQSLASKAAGRTRLLGRRHTEAQAAAAAKEIDALANEYEQVETQIRQTSPRYAALTQPEPPSLKEIQEQLLDQDTLLLEYSLGNEKSYVWSATPTSIASYELPPRTEIESQTHRLYDLLTARNLHQAGETEGQRRARVADADAQYPDVASRLSEMVLAPMAAQLGRKRLLVVSDGPLGYLPFAALIDPAGLKKGGGSRQPLIATHEIVNLPSASVLMAQRRGTAGRRPPAKALAVLADPVFEETDPRVRAVAEKQGQSIVNNVMASAAGDRKTPPATLPQAMRDIEQAARDVGDVGEGWRIRRLPFSRLEAGSIIALAPPKQALEAVDFRASRQTAMGAELAQYRLVHFATHGFLDNKHPELSGIVLSLIDEGGQPVDGFLRLNEIYNLHLPADLVVLSACQTGLGKQIKGEGLIGLVRGFMYAGAERVTASLWKVDDEATAGLMRVFYERMLKEGMRPAAALRAAQLEVGRQKRWQSPYYWAAFVLQGEWK